jgi:hypothetical protein
MNATASIQTADLRGQFDIPERDANSRETT